MYFDITADTPYSNTPFFQKILKAINDFGMLDCASLLVGFSGGADSCAMLDVLHSLCKTSGIRLFALHVNHMIRGDEADRDQLFCQNFCSERGIPITVIKKDVPTLAKSMGMGIEECAREFRYSSFYEFCAKEGIERIATAHNANDNTETVLFNLARGSGLRGLCGIPPVRDNIIRPLIYCQKGEIIEYCHQKGIKYMEDSTNSSIQYTRNFIRHQITPALLQVNKEAISSISRCSVLLRQDLSALEEIAEANLQASDSQLKKLPDAIITRVLLLRYKNYGFDPSCLEEKHISRLLDLFKTGKTGDCISLPNKSEAVRRREGMEFRCKTEPRQRSEEIIKLHYGINQISSLDCRIDLLKAGEFVENVENIENVYKMSMKAEIFSDTIEWISSVYCKARSDGDSYRFGGMTRSVKKLLWQKKIAPEDRINYPVICDDKGIALLPGFPPRDDLSVKNKESFIIHIHLFKK